MSVADIQTQLRSADIDCHETVAGGVVATIKDFSRPYTVLCKPFCDSVRIQLLHQLASVDIVDINLLCRELQSRCQELHVNFGYFPSCGSVALSAFVEEDTMCESLAQLGQLLDVALPLFIRLQNGEPWDAGTVDLALRFADGTA